MRTTSPGGKIVDGGFNLCLPPGVAALPDLEKCTSSPHSGCERNNEVLKHKELEEVQHGCFPDCC